MLSGKIKFALAQITPAKGNIAENLKIHQRYSEEAANAGADIIVFPELSLTGYEPSLLAELAQEPSSAIFQEISKIAVNNNLTVIVGCPLQSEGSKPYIGAVIGHPSGDIEFYNKQYLHSGESAYCSAGSENYSFTMKQTKIALAVCADFTERQHQKDALAESVDVYLVSALISIGGFAADEKLLSDIANQLNTPVLLSNFIGETGGWETAGKSGVWDKSGDTVFQGSDKSPGITYCTICNGKVKETYFSIVEDNN
ncbi:carbon-nitrogen hydrolase family protein [Vibrio hannami]|uniref:carbon-nitrogen hydrolase family protein n=1 Tax=Vibrio hannami TaxID=2717094 RepID=UPI0024104709|nr:carbon-nitrogen hydrolase family protein [Vibrio hannami]MDG3087785.1 carbon-nitrogen hydrolase family protein [Vibrio hannami]